MVPRASCVFVGAPAVPACSETGLQWHHPIKQQRLKHLFPRGAIFDVDLLRWKPIDKGTTVSGRSQVRTLAELLGDARNRVWICERHHELVTKGRIYVTFPSSVWAFARELGLDGMLENDLAREGRGRRSV